MCAWGQEDRKSVVWVRLVCRRLHSWVHLQLLQFTWVDSGTALDLLRPPALASQVLAPQPSTTMPSGGLGKLLWKSKWAGLGLCGQLWCGPLL